MEFINSYDIEAILIKKDLVRIGDLINLEGPVLSLFQNKLNADLYLFDWADSDENTNRWLVYKINAEVLNSFLLRKVSYKFMFETIAEESFYYTDIVNSDNIDYTIKGLVNLPFKYKPTKEILFDENDSKNLSAIFQIINSKIPNRNNLFIENIATRQWDILDSLEVNSYHYDVNPTELVLIAVNIFPHSPYKLEGQNARKGNQLFERERVGL